MGDTNKTDPPLYATWWQPMKVEAVGLLGVPYVFGATPSMQEYPPYSLDCSQMNVYLYHRQGFLDFPDGSWLQYDQCKPVDVARPGDLGFWLDERFATEWNPKGVYHTGMIIDHVNVIEARAKDSKGRYGKVILRPRERWEAWPKFSGWMRWEGVA